MFPTILTVAQTVEVGCPECHKRTLKVVDILLGKMECSNCGYETTMEEYLDVDFDELLDRLENVSVAQE